METIYDTVNTEARTVWYRERPDTETVTDDERPGRVTRRQQRRIDAYCKAHNIPSEPPF